MPLLLCVINVDEVLFNPALLTQGQPGGHAAAQQLTQRIAEYVTVDNIQSAGRLSFWVTLFFNREQLMDALTDNNICTREQFEAFLAGFTQASPRFFTVDVGYGSDASTIKIKETFTYFPQTLRVLLGGIHGPGYAKTFNSLNEKQLSGKLVMLQNSGDPTLDVSGLFVPSFNVNGLFITKRLSRAPKTPAPISVGPFKSITTNGGLISPQSPARTVGRMIDPSLPLHKQCPPPCNEHYLMTCSKGEGECKYSHDYVLSQEQLVVLASNAKKAPCNWLKNDIPCPFGESCCWGHVCPNGSKCYHLSKGRCWFKGEAMHPPISLDSYSS